MTCSTRNKSIAALIIRVTSATNIRIIPEKQIKFIEKR
nr:MAG TPA: hypothetical protein [Caudoviricetes sp.]